MSAGIDGCLQIFHASNLVREANNDAEPKPQTPPAIGKTEVGQLWRLVMSAATLLCKAADERIASLNRFWYV